MTSLRFNARQAQARAETEAYDSLPPALRAAIDSAPRSVRASVVLSAMLRGVSVEKIIETINRSPK